MKLDRNVNENGTGKYALLNLRSNKIEWGAPCTEEEFFVIKLKDRYAQAALNAYVKDVIDCGDDPEWAAEVQRLADRSSEDNPWCKQPD